MGVEPTNDHQALDLAALPICVPRRFIKVAQEGVEPSASLGLSKGGLPVAYRAKFGEKDSNLHRLVQSRAAYH